MKLVPSSCYWDKDRATFPQYSRRVKMEVTVYLLTLLTAIAGFFFYMQSGDYRAGILFAIPLVEVVTKLGRSTCQGYKVLFASKHYQSFKNHWEQNPPQPIDIPGAWRARCRGHLMIDGLLCIPRIDKVTLRYEDWQGVVASISKGPDHEVWSCILASYAVFQAAAAKLFAHAWAHSIVVPLLLADDIQCQTRWSWSDPRLRFFEPDTLFITRFDAAAHDGEDVPRKWLVEDTFQLDILEHIVLFLLGWDALVFYLLSHIPLNEWRNMITNLISNAPFSNELGLHQLLVQPETCGMDAAGRIG